MTQARKPAGIPTGGQFAPTNRPEASGIELVDDDAIIRSRVEIRVTTGIPSFSVEGMRDRDGRETRDRVRAAMLSSDLAWPMGKITVHVAEPAPARAADLDLEIALGILQASDQLPSVDVGGLRGELGLDGSIRGEATTDARSLRALVNSLKTDSSPVRGNPGPTSLERCRSLGSYAVAIGHLVDELGDDVQPRVVEAIQDAEELFEGILDELQATRELIEQGRAAHTPAEPVPGPSATATEAVTGTTTGTVPTMETAPAPETAADRSWRLFRESYGSWLDLYRKARAMGGMADTERRLREAAGLAGIDAAQLRADKARAYRGETSEQILEGR